jgi:hypothetical protein
MFQKMMAYGYIRWDIPDMSSTKRGKKLIETVVETISECFDFPDDTVQLQIIKGTTSPRKKSLCRKIPHPNMRVISLTHTFVFLSSSQLRHIPFMLCAWRCLDVSSTDVL